MNKEILQKIKMCIATYFNLYGILPGIRKVAEWTGESDELISRVYAAEGIAIAGSAA